MVCKDGTETYYALGDMTTMATSLVIQGKTGCSNTIPLARENEHSVRLDNKTRDKILKLLGVMHSETISAETAKTLNVESEYSLTDKRDEYYFFGADYSTTDQFDNYNNSDYLVQYSREYRRVTDIDKINSIIENQIGATYYINHDDRLLDQALTSSKVKLDWIDFSLQSFGLDDVEEFPVFQAKNPAYIIIIPTALSENNPFHVFSDLYVAGDTIGRRLVMALHVDSAKTQTLYTNASDAIKVELDES